MSQKPTPNFSLGSNCSDVSYHGKSASTKSFDEMLEERGEVTLNASHPYNVKLAKRKAENCKG